MFANSASECQAITRGRSGERGAENEESRKRELRIADCGRLEANIERPTSNAQLRKLSRAGSPTLNERRPERGAGREGEAVISEK